MTASRRPAEIATVFVLRDDGAALLQHRDELPGLSRAGMWCRPAATAIPARRSRRAHGESSSRRRPTAPGELRRLATVDDEEQGQLLTVFWTRYDGRESPVCGEGQALEFVPRSAASGLPVPMLVVELWDDVLAAAGIEPAVRGHS